MLDVGFGFYMVKFDLPQDTKKVVSGGPQMVFDHYPTVRPWIRGFAFRMQEVWVAWTYCKNMSTIKGGGRKYTGQFLRVEGQMATLGFSRRVAKSQTLIQNQLG